ncbi:MAG: rhodanese-like domain-containing protein [Chitinophagaceae bacterium]|nr:MAG: rhodanese-like domain-containing protein [Chitinophagaceae bacterium]
MTLLGHRHVFADEQKGYLGSPVSVQLNSDKDYGCLTDISLLNEESNNYQLIDIRGEQSRHKLPVDAWVIPIQELRYRSQLKNQPILLLGENFSRAAGAVNCAILKNAGFSRVKMLVGGAQAWIDHRFSANAKVTFNNFVTPEELLFEYFNGQVLIVSLSKEITVQLKNIGLEVAFTVSESLEGKIESQLTSFYQQRAGALYPVVIVGAPSQTVVLPLDYIYILSGGIIPLRSQKIKNQLSNEGLKGLNEGGVCAKQ